MHFCLCCQVDQSGQVIVDDYVDTKPAGMVTEKRIVDTQTNNLYDWVGEQHGELDHSMDKSLKGDGTKTEEVATRPCQMIF